MQRWLALSEKAFPAEKFGEDPSRAEAWVGPIEGRFSPGDLEAFRAEASDASTPIIELLEHPLHRHLVKLLVFATRHVPEPLVRPLLVAAADTINPSFNKHFVAPCSLVYGRRRVVGELLDIAMRGTDSRKQGATNALYWGAMPREHHMWPDARRPEPFDGPPDDPVDDLLAGFDAWAVREFMDSGSLDVQRVLVRYVAAPTLRDTELGRAAIAAARVHPDPYIRDRLRYDLGESSLIPCLPHREQP